MGFLSRHSYLLGSLVLVAAGIYFAFYFVAYQNPIGTGTLVVAALLLIFHVLARRGHLTPANPSKRIRRALSAGRPVIVHFYSDTSFLSLVQRVLSAAGERQAKGRCDLIFISLSHPEAAPVAEELQAGLGDFLLFGADGSLIAKARRLTPDGVDRMVNRVS